MRQIRKRLTYANVMSSLAVFMVLGGGAAIAANLPKNSVGTPQLKRNAVKAGKIGRNAVRTGKLAPKAVRAGKLAKNAVPTNRLRDNAVTSGKILDGSILTGEIANGAVTTGKIANDAVTGEKVKESSLGQVPDAAKLNSVPPSGFLGSGIIVARGSTSVTTGNRGFVNVACPTGHRVIGGGVRFENFNDEHMVSYNGPAFAGQSVVLPGNNAVPTAWQASAVNGAAVTETLFVWAVCSKLNTP